MPTTLLVILGLSVLILGHELGHFAAARWFKLKVDEFGFGFPPRILARKKGETEYSLNWLPFGGFVRIAGETDRLEEDQSAWDAMPEEEKRRYFRFQPAWRRALVIVAGVLVNFVIGWLLISAIFMIGTPAVLLISGVQPDSPAAQVGLESGDIIAGYTEAQAFIDYINAHRGEEITLTVKREGQDFTFTATPRVDTKRDEGALGVLLAESGISKHSVASALGQGFLETINISWFTVVGFSELVGGLVRGTLVEGIVGPIGIFAVAQATGELGLIYLFQLLALISVNLAVINLIPFPALDGGRLLLIGLEKLKGSPLSVKVETAVNVVGFAFLILLMVVLSIRDIGRWF